MGTVHEATTEADWDYCRLYGPCGEGVGLFYGKSPSLDVCEKPDSVCPQLTRSKKCDAGPGCMWTGTECIDGVAPTMEPTKDMMSCNEISKIEDEEVRQFLCDANK